MSQFGPQSPSPRSLLAVARREEPELLTAWYPTLPPPRHKSSNVLSADVGEIVVLAEAPKGKPFTVHGKRPQASTAASDADGRALERILEVLWDDERLLLLSGGKHDFRTPRPDDTIDLLCPMSRSGALLSEGVSNLRPDCAFNGGFLEAGVSEWSGNRSVLPDTQTGTQSMSRRAWTPATRSLSRSTKVPLMEECLRIS